MITLKEGQKRVVFFISDRTGLTAESYGQSLLAQFPNQEYQFQRLSFIDTAEQAQLACDLIHQEMDRTGIIPIVFSTLVDDETRSIVDTCDACVIGLFNTFIEPLETLFGEKSAHTLGSSRQIFRSFDYQKRLDAIDYTMLHDDGIRPDRYDQADVILTGVSRSGKTPVSLFLAMTFAVKVANYPITDHELKSDYLPDCLSPFTKRLIGLTIQPRRLSDIRLNRRSSQEYSSLATCNREVKAVERMFANSKIPVFDSTTTSIEELSGNVMKVLGLNRV
ncbi:MAG: FIG137360: hypothetical protein [uncultured Thiotrichaceae bacterium]|uniref:Uncharacterized protein n=1 Tax=uncultured Thiotrichaceae bacterium TaxID=298394 RepID=A0A6S6TRR4_9GAMM|nr:MAG: FIG137360: hypothetical protein [uncultured Thiotrichaceae bacterium]